VVKLILLLLTLAKYIAKKRLRYRLPETLQKVYIQKEFNALFIKTIYIRKFTAEGG